MLLGFNEPVCLRAVDGIVDGAVGAFELARGRSEHFTQGFVAVVQFAMAAAVPGFRIQGLEFGA